MLLASVSRVVLALTLVAAPVLAQGPSYGSPSRGNSSYPTAPVGAEGGGGPVGAPELDPNWTTAGLVLLIGGAILVAGSRRRERLAG